MRHRPSRRQSSEGSQHDVLAQSIKRMIREALQTERGRPATLSPAPLDTQLAFAAVTLRSQDWAVRMLRDQSGALDLALRLRVAAPIPPAPKHGGFSDYGLPLAAPDMSAIGDWQPAVLPPAPLAPLRLLLPIGWQMGPPPVQPGFAGDNLITPKSLTAFPGQGRILGSPLLPLADCPSAPRSAAAGPGFATAPVPTHYGALGTTGTGGSQGGGLFPLVAPAGPGVASPLSAPVSTILFVDHKQTVHGNTPQHNERNYCGPGSIMQSNKTMHLKWDWARLSV